MTARERAEKIARAAHRSEHATPFDDLMSGAREGWTRIALAAVRAAYEIDGVRELVEAAERVKYTLEEYGWCEESANAAGESAAAAARVREAMGGGA